MSISHLYNPSGGLNNLGSGINEVKQLIVEPQQAKLASGVYRQLASYIIEFEQKLKGNEEVGLRLISFGESVIIHVENIGYSDPYLLCFYGSNEDGKPVQLIQNMSQLSFLLTAVSKTIPERTPIGFTLQEALKKLED